MLWGLGIGVVFGCGTYGVLELMPARCPSSVVGRVRRWIMGSAAGRWVRIRDGWAVWEDGGREEEWRRWSVEWEKVRLGKRVSKTQ